MQVIYNGQVLDTINAPTNGGEAEKALNDWLTANPRWILSPPQSVQYHVGEGFKGFVMPRW